MQPLPKVILQAWSHTVTTPSSTLILPDGCRDLILKFSRHDAPCSFVSPLHDTAHAVASQPGDRYVGYRFQPAAVFDADTLLRAVRGRETRDADTVLALVEELVRVDSGLAEALAALAESGSVAAARRALGASERGLERRLLAASARAPAWWRGLARARRAAAALHHDIPLAAIAADTGYADQAHMSRDFRRWFGLAPSRLRANPALLATATESGYGAA